MTTGMITMSQKEITRLEIIQRVISKELTQVSAGKQLNLSERQVRNLKRRYLSEGAKGLISKRRGTPSNNRLDAELQLQAIERLKTCYADFGPSLACEKLQERHGLKLSKESVRHLMIQVGLWKGKKRKRVKPHQQRERREALGDLVQVDGSRHAWFEARAGSCCLLVIIDDATGRLLGLRFEQVETTQGYFRLFKTYLKTQGRPLACYHDKHSIFQVNAKEPRVGDSITQFERAMNELGIESISANTPQAKGRVERVNKTLQDRLVKELRLQGISDIPSANDFLPQFMKAFNEKFAVVPRNAVDAHRPTLPDEGTLDLLLSEQHSRKVTKNLEVNFQNKIYQIKTDTQSYTMRGARVSVCVGMKGQIALLYKGKPLPYTVHEKQKKVSKVVSAKEINRLVDSFKIDARARGHKPSSNHPWRQYSTSSSHTRQATI